MQFISDFTPLACGVGLTGLLMARTMHFPLLLFRSITIHHHQGRTSIQDHAGLTLLFRCNTGIHGQSHSNKVLRWAETESVVWSVQSSSSSCNLKKVFLVIFSPDWLKMGKNGFVNIQLCSIQLCMPKYACIALKGAVHKLCRLSSLGGGQPQRRFTKQTLPNKKDNQKSSILRQHSLWTAPKRQLTAGLTCNVLDSRC